MCDGSCVVRPHSPSAGRALSDHRPDHRVEGSHSRDDFDDLCRVHLFDWLEQVPRSQEWDYRRAAYRKMAERLGKPVQEYCERLYSQRAPSAINSC